ncbi:DUF4321 domain-containing protein [Alicyclobacillus shizuokensis]|uniref:DUF4321 domain-containing protein n=1 Tax=Alicyclobacillus shizuokensis TaxID=392014 RepID=UPI0008337A86|nr:DUF4321 domain-containing protein [Alicyclobacillus shizuokensis]MCL6625407.1 DUF4321 domain-containing protein [Alicyclobacillus shizuokensis]
MRGSLGIVVYMLLGAILGTVAGQLLAHQVPWLARQAVVRMNPSGDLSFLRFSLDLTFRVNWLTLVGVVAALVFGRRRK